MMDFYASLVYINVGENHNNSDQRCLFVDKCVGEQRQKLG